MVQPVDPGYPAGVAKHTSDAGSPCVDVDDLVDIAGIMERFSVSRSRVYAWMELPGFPAPLKVFPGGRLRIWSLEEVVAWRRERIVWQRNKLDPDAI